MRTLRRSSERGQALIMVTVALLAMCGLIGMAVDFGWSYFVRREAQAAADAAALAAANAAMTLITTNGASALACSTSSTGLTCGSPTPCATSIVGTFLNACEYAQQNGFSQGGDNGRQTVTVAGGVFATPAAPPTAPGVNTRYWVTVRITQTIPQLYSAVLGNANATVSARATAAIVDFLAQGSVIGLNREGDPAPAWQCGTCVGTSNPDLLIGSGTQLIAPGGVTLSSKDSGAGANGGSISPVAPFTLTRGGVTPASSWTSASPSTNQADGQQFLDPFRGMAQPPVTSSQLNPVPVPGGTLTSAICTPSCPQGYYYASVSPTNTAPTGQPITISSNVNFANGGNFGDYVFYGGLGITNATVSFGPGRYVLAGVAPTSPPTAGLSIGAGATVFGGNGNDAGRLFINTDPNYPGLGAVAPVPSGMPTLSFGQAVISAGADTVALHGLNSAKTLPTDTNPLGYELTDFGNALIWNDQRYSSNTTPQLVLGGTNLIFDGVIYQPRGAWTQVQPGASISGLVGGLRFVTGALDVGGSSVLNLCKSSCTTPKAFWNRTVALVE